MRKNQNSFHSKSITHGLVLSCKLNNSECRYKKLMHTFYIATRRYILECLDDTRPAVSFSGTRRTDGECQLNITPNSNKNVYTKLPNIQKHTAFIFIDSSLFTIPFTCYKRIRLSEKINQCSVL